MQGSQLIRGRKPTRSQPFHLSVSSSIVSSNRKLTLTHCWKIIQISFLALCFTCLYTLMSWKFISLPSNTSFYRFHLLPKCNESPFRIPGAAQQSDEEHWRAQDQDGLPFFWNPRWVYLSNNQRAYEGPRHCVRYVWWLPGSGCTMVGLSIQAHWHLGWAQNFLFLISRFFFSF